MRNETISANHIHARHTDDVLLLVAVADVSVELDQAVDIVLEPLQMAFV